MITNIEFRLVDQDDGAVRVDMRLPKDGGLTDGWSHMADYTDRHELEWAIGSESLLQHHRNGGTQ